MLNIDSKEFTFETARSGGPGGQHVNKVSTRVTLCFNVLASASLSASQKRRILEQLSNRVNAEGVLRVTSRRHRSQAANRNAAVQRFYELVEAALARPRARIPTRKPAAAVRRRLDTKNRRSQLKRRRRRPLADDSGGYD